MKLWVSWYDLQQAAPVASRDASWNNLTDSAGARAYLARLDAQIRAANDDGVRTLLTIYQAFPTWATGATGGDPLSPKGPECKLPANLTISGPWAWFVGYLSARYNGAYNATGPHTPAQNESRGAYYGNPLRAKLDAIEFINEPNRLYWPMDDIVDATATMMQTAASVSAQWGGQAIVGPATSDSVDATTARAGVTMDWRTFTSQLLTALTGWQPPVPAYWSQHNYKDVKSETPALASRAEQTVDMLYAQGWKGGLQDHDLWLTEGGLDLGRSWADPAARQAQASKLQKSFDAMRTLPDVVMWTQHGINDVGTNDFKSGLRDDFDFSAPGPGPVRPAWSTWMSLTPMP